MSPILRSIWLSLAVAALSHAALTVTKVEPPNWWIHHTRNPIQVLLTGENLKGATVSAVSKGFRVDTRGASENGHYLFAYLTIDASVKPGLYHFAVKGCAGT